MASVAIHNKNGKGLLQTTLAPMAYYPMVAIHNKNGQGLLQKTKKDTEVKIYASQSTIKMDKGYYKKRLQLSRTMLKWSQSTIKMEKGYYLHRYRGYVLPRLGVAIHNKNGKGLLPQT